MNTQVVWSNTACETVDLLKARELHPRDVLHALAGRIGEVNPIVNALVSLCVDRAMEQAEKARNLAPLHGLPIPIKDSYAVNGVRTTWGSLAFDNHIPDHSDLVVHSIESAGGLVYAKSNTPEFEAGASTFNEVFGRTLNPWNTGYSAAGSSGGAAVAVASGMAFIAQGSDFACSVRYPASFCGICGLRPTPGLIPQGPNRLPYQTLSVIGPLARNVADLGLGLDALAGFDPRDPLTRPTGDTCYRQAGETPLQPPRAAYSPNLGVAVVSNEVRRKAGEALEKLAGEGMSVELAHPDLEECHDSFRTLRAFQFSAMWSDVLETSRDRLKPEVVWNIEEGLKLSATDIARAEAARARLRRSMLAFLDEYNFLISPTAPVPPNPADQRFVKEIEGIPMHSYLDWLSLGYAVTITGCPSLSIPCGFTDAGLPIGIQIIGRPHCEAELLRVGAWIEEVLGARMKWPIDPHEQ